MSLLRKIEWEKKSENKFENKKFALKGYVLLSWLLVFSGFPTVLFVL
jgi:hypothetical protein